jgi:hypothetical protein
MAGGDYFLAGSQQQESIGFCTSVQYSFPSFSLTAQQHSSMCLPVRVHVKPDVSVVVLLVAATAPRAINPPSSSPNVLFVMVKPPPHSDDCRTGARPLGRPSLDYYSAEVTAVAIAPTRRCAYASSEEECMAATEGTIRLTVEIPKELWRRARVRAAETDRDLREVVIEALEAMLGKPTKKGGGS